MGISIFVKSLLISQQQRFETMLVRRLVLRKQDLEDLKLIKAYPCANREEERHKAFPPRRCSLHAGHIILHIDKEKHPESWPCNFMANISRARSWTRTGGNVACKRPVSLRKASYRVSPDFFCSDFQADNQSDCYC